MNLSKILEEWKGTLITPTKTMSKLKSKASLGGGMIHLAIALVISTIISAIAMMLSGLGFGIVAVIGIVIMGIILGAILVLVFEGVMFVVAKILGGKGSFGTQLHLTYAPYAPLTIASTILGLIPVVGGWLGLLLAVYYLYPLTIAMKETHKLGTVKAVVAWLVPAVLAFIVSAIAAVAMQGLYTGIAAP